MPKIGMSNGAQNYRTRFSSSLAPSRRGLPQTDVEHASIQEKMLRSFASGQYTSVNVRGANVVPEQAQVKSTPTSRYWAHYTTRAADGAPTVLSQSVRTSNIPSSKYGLTTRVKRVQTITLNPVSSTRPYTAQRPETDLEKGRSCIQQSTPRYNRVSDVLLQQDRHNLRKKRTERYAKQYKQKLAALM